MSGLPTRHSRRLEGEAPSPPPPSPPPRPRGRRPRPPLTESYSSDPPVNNDVPAALTLRDPHRTVYCYGRNCGATVRNRNRKECLEALYGYAPQWPVERPLAPCASSEGDVSTASTSGWSPASNVNGAERSYLYLPKTPASPDFIKQEEDTSRLTQHTQRHDEVT
ncbi:hypothetical protein B0H19DRAFT_1084656 [Mycena capillaripes]|nr:hypothetical protein B0H19DRAFT_1084656 [Mycena capillaripes]